MPELDVPAPKYRQIAALLREQILRGDLRPGDELPSERVIAVQYSVSRPTATKALDVLRQEGLAEAVRGSGTYVSAPPVNRRARERYQRARDEGAIYPQDEYAVIVAAGLIDEAPASVRANLGLPAGARVVRRRRVTHDATGPREISTSWLAAAVAEKAPLLLETERIRQGTLQYVESATGRRGAQARDRVSARLASAEESALLGLPPDEPTPVLCVEHVVCDAQGQPLEFAEAVYPPGAWTYEQQYDL